MQLKNGWHEVGSNQCDYRKELDHCTIRISRSLPGSTLWLIEITVSYMMTGTIKQLCGANNAEEAMEKAEIVATENFAKLKGFYIRLLRELD